MDGASTNTRETLTQTPTRNNDHTGETTFTKPMLPAPPEGCSVHAHGDEGQHYFQHDASGGGTQWHHPHDDDPSSVQLAKTWFFADASDAMVRHGPYTLTKLQRWLAEKELDATTLVRDGREGEDVELGSLPDNPVTKQTLRTRPGGEAVAAAATVHDDSEWVTRFSDDHGANYYKHRVTGEKRWEMPAEHGGERKWW